VRKLIASTTSHAGILLGMSHVTCPHILAPAGRGRRLARSFPPITGLRCAASDAQA
jgi:hypothetical protein